MDKLQYTSSLVLDYSKVSGYDNNTPIMWQDQTEHPTQGHCLQSINSTCRTVELILSIDYNVDSGSVDLYMYTVM